MDATFWVISFFHTCQGSKSEGMALGAKSVQGTSSGILVSLGIDPTQPNNVAVVARNTLTSKSRFTLVSGRSSFQLLN
jgi:hypothetical protein